MATAEELKEQIKALLKQIMELQGQLGDLLSDSEKLDLIKSIIGSKTHESENQNQDEFDEELQQEYIRALDSAYSSGYKKINSEEVELIITFQDTRLSIDIEKSLKEVDEIGIELIDNKKINNAVRNVTKKYEKHFKNGKIGGVGTGAGTELIARFFIEALVIWSLRHILTDLDDVIWEKLKKSLLKIFKSAKTINDKETVAIITSFNPQIVFIFPLKTDTETISEELINLSKLTKEITEKNKNQNMAYKYTYNPETEKWELETKC